MSIANRDANAFCRAISDSSTRAACTGTSAAPQSVCTAVADACDQAASMAACISSVRRSVAASMAAVRASGVYGCPVPGSSPCSACSTAWNASMAARNLTSMVFRSGATAARADAVDATSAPRHRHLGLRRGRDVDGHLGAAAEPRRRGLDRTVDEALHGVRARHIRRLEAAEHVRDLLVGEAE